MWHNPTIEMIKGNNTEEGMKFDDDKNRLALVLRGFAKAIWRVGEVGTFGARKYAPDSWQKVQHGKKRYLNAMLRHLFLYFQGKMKDSESGFSHLSHVAWNALAVLTLEIEENENI